MVEAAVTLPSLEEALQAFVDAIQTERDGGWAACDAAAYLCDQAATPRDKARMVNQLASLGHCTSAMIRIRVQLSKGYGSEERPPDVAQALFRACLGAARRLNLRPWQVMQLALEKGYHAAEVAQLGRPAKRLRVLAATCGGCGLVARLRVTDGEASAALVCPRCVVWAWADGRDGKDAERLGVLA